MKVRFHGAYVSDTVVDLPCVPRRGELVDVKDIDNNRRVIAPVALVFWDLHKLMVHVELDTIGLRPQEGEHDRARNIER